MYTSCGDDKNPILRTFKAKNFLTGPLTNNFTVTLLSFKNHFSGTKISKSYKSDFYLLI